MTTPEPTPEEQPEPKPKPEPIQELTPRPQPPKEPRSAIKPDPTKDPTEPDKLPPGNPFGFRYATEANTRKKLERQKIFMKHIADGKPIQEACALTGIKYRTYARWRLDNKKFGAEITTLRRYHMRKYKKSSKKQYEDFGLFRKEILNHDNPWFHQHVVDALSDAEPGSITVILLPPEHGKSTLVEDWTNFKLAWEPNFRIVFASERQAMAKKMLARVQTRMTEGGGLHPYLKLWGPFVKPKGDTTGRTPPWTSTHLSVWKNDSDERDYNLEAVGVGGSIIGSRIDRLFIDDPQSMKTLSTTQDRFETIRQDWFSRPGSKGAIVFLGSRVGDGDIWSILEESGIVDKWIRIPAWTQDNGWLWPERYTEAEYKKIRRNVGEDAWARNYMQQPRFKGGDAFTETLKEKTLNKLRTVDNEPPKPKDGGPTRIAISVDPGYATNAICVCALEPSRMLYLTGRTDQNLSRSDQIVQLIENYLIEYTLDGGKRSQVTDVIIETMAFQKGLAEDEGLKELQRRYGFRIRPHLTGHNKYDSNIGVPQMAHSMMREELDFPYGDTKSELVTNSVWSELFAWRPLKSGKRLKQDQVMTLWFAWVLWRDQKRSVRLDPSQFSFKAVSSSAKGPFRVIPKGVPAK